MVHLWRDTDASHRLLMPLPKVYVLKMLQISKWPLVGSPFLATQVKFPLNEEAMGCELNRILGCLKIEKDKIVPFWAFW